MVIDSSAIIAILLDESEAEAFAIAIQNDSMRFLSAASLLETAMVIESRHGLDGGQKLDEFVSTANLQIKAVTATQAEIARTAFRSYGKGRHRASLNFGDCFACALAKSLDESLLFKGNDFTETDIQPAVSG